MSGARLAPVTTGTGTLVQCAREDDSTLRGGGNVPDVVAALRLCRRGLVAVGKELATLDAVAGGYIAGDIATP